MCWAGDGDVDGVNAKHCVCFHPHSSYPPKAGAIISEEHSLQVDSRRVHAFVTANVIVHHLEVAGKGCSA